MKKLLSFCVLLMAFSIAAMSQTPDKPISGTVVSAGDGEPLVGVTLMPVGGGSGAATDVDGKFTMRVPASCKKIKVSYVGMETQTVDISAQPMHIVMTAVENRLDEVMVVAYGVAKRSAYTGSATVISADEIAQTQVTNALNALTGKVAGVQMTNSSGEPGDSSPTIRIRGISSINAGNDPLIVVDGAPFSGSLNSISAQDIESMTVLKDAASNALYGARGANGVILITTKKGGTKSDGAVVTVDAKWGANNRATQLYNTIKDPRQYYEIYYAALRNQALGNGMSAAAAHAYANENLISGSMGLGYLPYTIPDGENVIGTNGKFNPNATEGRIVEYGGQQFLLKPDNWLDAAFTTGFRQEYNVSVSNGGEKSDFYMSANYLDNQGITPESGYSRLAFRLAADLQAKDWLKIGGTASYSHYKGKYMLETDLSNSSANIFAVATSMAPIYPLFIRDASGNVMHDVNGFTRYDYGDGANGGFTRPVYPDSNPLSSSYLNTEESIGNTFQGNGYVEIRFLKDFKFTSNNSFSIDNTRYTSVTNPFYGSYVDSNGIVYKYNYQTWDYTLQQLLNWNRQFGAHSVAVLLGHEYYMSHYDYLQGSRTDMFDQTNDELAGAIKDNGAYSYRTDYNTEGWFGRVQYDFDNRYFASVSYRRDASSRFHPDHRWGDFYSVGVAWRISQEKFFHVDWVNELKFKLSYGEQGNDNISDYLYTNLYTLGNGSGNPAAMPYSMGNEDITWEKGGNLNAGFEFELFNSRLGGSAEAFYRKTSDMLFSFPLPYSYGYSYYYANVGDMTNTGLEVDLYATPIKTRDFKWDLNLNLTFYKNKITKLPQERKTITVDGVQGFASSSFFYGEGEPIYTYYMNKSAGVDPETGQALYYQTITHYDDAGNKTGEEITTTTKSSEATKYLCGSALPDVYGGFGTSLTYRGFDLSVNFTYQLGGQIYDGSYESYMSSPSNLTRGYNVHADLLNAWTPDNKTSGIPAIVYNDTNAAASSDRFLTDASYLNLQNINFGYTLPQALTRKIQVDKVRIYFSADNVWLWSKRQGLDPRTALSGTVTGTTYSPIRTLSGGINVSF